MKNKERANKVLEMLYMCNNNKSQVARAMGIKRSNIYSTLKTLREDGLVDEHYNVRLAEEVMKDCLDVAYKAVGQDRVDVVDNKIIIYNIMDNERGLSKGELRARHGYNEPDIFVGMGYYGNYDTSVDFTVKPCSIERFKQVLQENEDWYKWVKANGTDTNNMKTL
jgi:DNA-binding transcriptional ArsR family regulator